MSAPRRHPEGERQRARRGRGRGFTLIEMLVVVSLAAIIAGMAVLGAGAAEGARLKRSSVMIASAVRVAYGHANAVSKAVRLVFDLDERTISIEEASGDLKITRNDATGGAAAATEAEKKALELADQILKGPRAPRPTFQPAKVMGFDPENPQKRSKELERNIRFIQIETGHDDLAAKSGRAYLYFWPGGQTERAAIQLGVGLSDDQYEGMTVLVYPLTGKAELRKGRATMPRPRDDADASERQDSGY